MLNVRYTNQLEKDIRRLVKRGYDISKFADTIKLLLQNDGMPERYRDHALKGKWSGFRDCHIEPDWVLIYHIDEDQLTLIASRTGTHSDLFD